MHLVHRPVMSPELVGAVLAEGPELLQVPEQPLRRRAGYLAQSPPMDRMEPVPYRLENKRRERLSGQAPYVYSRESVI